MNPFVALTSGFYKLQTSFLSKHAHMALFQQASIPVSQKSNLHYTRGITPKRVTRARPISSASRLGNTAQTKSRSAGEPLATLCSI